MEGLGRSFEAVVASLMWLWSLAIRARIRDTTWRSWSSMTYLDTAEYPLQNRAPPETTNFRAAYLSPTMRTCRALPQRSR